MPDQPVKLDLSITSDMAVIAKAAADITCKALDADAKRYDSMSPASKDMSDRIRFQMYWDWRAVLKWAHIVGDELEWPPKPEVKP